MTKAREESVGFSPFARAVQEAVGHALGAPPSRFRVELQRDMVALDGRHTISITWADSMKLTEAEIEQVKAIALQALPPEYRDHAIEIL